MDKNYFLHKVKHELCLVNNIVHLNNDVYSISMPVVIPKLKLNATDGRTLMQRIIFQHLNSNASRAIGFLRGMFNLCSEPDNFETHLMLTCPVGQLSEATETEWIRAMENGLDSGQIEPPVASMGKDVYINAWGIQDYIYDMKVEFWPHTEKPNAFQCHCAIKFIKPEGIEETNHLDFESGFNFLIYSEKSNCFVPFLIQNENNPVFFLQEANIVKYELIEDEDGIGRELFVECEIGSK